MDVFYTSLIITDYIIGSLHFTAQYCFLREWFKITTKSAKSITTWFINPFATAAQNPN